MIENRRWEEYGKIDVKRNIAHTNLFDVGVLHPIADGMKTPTLTSVC